MVTPEHRADAAAPAAAAPAAPPRRRRVALLKALSFRNISAAYVLAGFVILYSIWIPEKFLKIDTIQSVLSDSSITALLAIAVVIPLAAAAFDLSVAAILGLCSAASAYLMGGPYLGLPWPLAVFLTLLLGAMIGGVNAALVVRWGVPSMIATLAMSSVLAGAGSAINLNNFLIGLPTSFTNVGQHNILGISSPFWALLVVSILIWYFLAFTTAGRYVYATGGGAEAARLSGVRTNRIVAGALISAAVVAAFAGIVATARVGAGQASIGPPYLLPAYAAAFLGSTQFGRGRFNVWGTILATYTLAFGSKGLILAGAPVWTPNVFDGVALALAVAMSVRPARARGGLRLRLRGAQGVPRPAP
jgi:ribose transport system permease protein